MSLKPKNLRPSIRQGTGLSLLDAPWRFKYFELPHDPGCFICRAITAAPRNDPKNLLLVRGEWAVIMLNRYPYTMGGLMVAPNAHLADVRAIDDETMLEMTRLAKRGMDLLEGTLKVGAFNLGINQGASAGAGLKDHIHMHIVPRWGGDTNFMTTSAGARVLSEDVDSMYRRLRRALRRLEGRS